LRIDFQGSRLTSDGGLLLVRELEDRLGLSALISKNMMDDRAQQEHSITAPESAATIHLQSLGRIKGGQVGSGIRLQRLVG